MRNNAILLAFVLLGGCGDDAPAGSPAMGALVYAEPLEGGNTFACATCHAVSEPAADGFVRPGHPLGDAAARPTFKDGTLTSLRDAVNSCVTEWMNADALGADDVRWLSLLAYLESEVPAAAAPAVDLQIVDPPTDLSTGDPVAGRALFDTRCIVCHGPDAVGTERGPGLAGSPLQRDYIARRVRTSGRMDSPTYDGLTGGIMPFWGADRLSDPELLDVVAYVEQRSMSMAMPDAGMPDAALPDAGPSGCDATHPSVGQTATLIERFHGTTGTARIVDDCTIVVEGFGYDGTGIDVRFYGAVGGAYGSGFAISEDLIRSGGYSGDTIRLTLPAGRTLDEVDGVSLWCVAAGVSFGDGLFM